MTEKEIDIFIKNHPSMSFYRNHMQEVKPDEVRDRIITSIGTPGNLNIWDGSDDALLDYIGMDKFIKKDSMGYKLSYDNHGQMAYCITNHIAHNICLMDNTYCNPTYIVTEKLLEFRSIYFMGISRENCWKFLNYDISSEIKEQLFYWCRWLNYTGCNNSKWYKDISKEFDNKRVATILEKNTGVTKAQIIKFLIMEDCYVGKKIHKEAMLKNEINVLFNDALFFIDVTKKEGYFYIEEDSLLNKFLSYVNIKVEKFLTKYVQELILFVLSTRTKLISLPVSSLDNLLHMFEMSLLGVKYEVVRTSELDETLVLRRKNG